MRQERRGGGGTKWHGDDHELGYHAEQERECDLIFSPLQYQKPVT